ncbi:MAG TPA: hypothetical protein DEG96_09970 [Candidatus Atribacteria bacterium]|nr:hypothetical protein [Candidatus Atribacteria bacterium]
MGWDKLIIDTNLKFSSDSNGGDPDGTSSTLRSYHKILWSKPLPNGSIFKLYDNKNGAYLYHKSELGEFFLGSDAITHSFKNHKRKQWLTKQIPNEVNELFEAGFTIGAYIVFPNNIIDGKHTINQARGVNSLIDDRFDLTLECIRLFYMGKDNPLYSTLLRYKNFFNLFDDFMGYIHFFLLDDLIDESNNIKFYLSFDNFKTRPTFSDVSQYLSYKKGVINFIKSRNNRIENYIKLKKTEHDTST